MVVAPRCPLTGNRRIWGLHMAHLDDFLETADWRVGAAAKATFSHSSLLIRCLLSPKTTAANIVDIARLSRGYGVSVCKLLTPYRPAPGQTSTQPLINLPVTCQTFEAQRAKLPPSFS